jgi:hypothetical protein
MMNRRTGAKRTPRVAGKTFDARKAGVCLPRQNGDRATAGGRSWKI